MKLGSLFDGSGGFPLAASRYGIEPVWASEVEPYPIAVTRSRFPEMKHLGDVRKINGAEIEPVDIITFGSPCQDLSIAGKRAGLKHENNGDDETTRSGLFMEAVRIIKEMRKATNGTHPTFAVWENVPGAFSSNGGEDFRVVLEELVKIVEPSASVPPPLKNGWAYADILVGDGWSIAYRVSDAQYWGVPQRRRRIYLVTDFAGERAGAILFEREGLRRYTAESGETRERTAPPVKDGVGATDSAFHLICAAFQGKAGGKASSIGYEAEKSPTLTAAACGFQAPCVILGSIASPAANAEITDGAVEPIILDRAFFNQGVNARFDPMLYENGIVPALISRGPHAVCYNLIVRRLTPTECARLQGFPDEWAEIEQLETLSDAEYEFWLDVRKTYDAINGNKPREYSREVTLKWHNALHTDSAEYKMWGNGIALPCAEYVMEGIAEVMKGV